MGGILGGGGKSSSTQTSGYAALPNELKSAFNKLGMGVEQYTNPNNAGVTRMFTPLAQTADETNAFNQMRQGFTPTSESIASDIAMQQNPYNQYVIDEINRQSKGANSILQQNLNSAGQLGSNRQMLGANDIDLSRTNQIGSFLQGQYNTALNNALNVLPQQRAQDAQNLTQIGQFQRGLAGQTNLAPVSALQAGTSMIGPFTAGGTGTSSQSSGSSLLGSLGSLASGVGTAWTAFSDITLKENIIPAGQENGHNIYEFSYKGSPKRYVGVMAQEVREIMPEAVKEFGGYLAVDYAMIGVTMREVA